MEGDAIKVLRLLRNARGHIDGIIKMLEERRGNMEISTQLLACQAMIKGANCQVIKGHTESCVRKAFLGELEAEEHINEMIKMIEKLIS